RGTQAKGPPGRASLWDRATPTPEPFATLAQLLAKLRVVPQCIVTDHPAVGHLLAPRCEHLQTLSVPCVIPPLLWHMALLTPLRIPRPVFGQRQAEIEQGMIAARDVRHGHPDLTGVDLATVPTPLPLHPDRMRAPLREAAGIEGDAPIECTQVIDDLANQHLDQRAMIPRRCADARLQEHALDID